MIRMIIDGVLCNVGFFCDIIDCKWVENVLWESNEKFEQLVDNISDMFWVCLLDMNKILYFSLVFEWIWGCLVVVFYVDLVQWRDFVLFEDCECMQFVFVVLVGEMCSLEVEYCIVWLDGEIWWVQVWGF